jgi:hypothetical protein
VSLNAFRLRSRFKVPDAPFVTAQTFRGGRRTFTELKSDFVVPYETGPLERSSPGCS